MAKKSKIVKNDQRRRMVERHAERRAELKQIVKRPSSTADATSTCAGRLAEDAARRQRRAPAQP